MRSRTALGDASRRLFLLLLVLWSNPVLAAAKANEEEDDGWDDFYNNFATDITPLLALFGEQATKQFLSESTTVWDNITFATVPLGIITALVSVIRVCGNSSLKAFIGRAQEGQAAAEAELCSSTGGDVCELWNRGGIARIFGRPKNIVFIHDETKHDGCFYPANETAVAGTAGLYKPSEYFREMEIARADASPSLSLNIGIRRPSPLLIYTAMLLGCILQLGMLAFAYWITYIKRLEKGNMEIPRWAFPLTATGTIFLVVGMFLCASLIEKSTKEHIFNTNTSTPTFYWLQPNNQTVGDQTFDAFAYSTKLKEYIVSQKNEYATRYRPLVWIALSFTLGGFIMQFIGLRGLHAFVALFQLAATIIMAAVRAGLRTRRLGENDNLLRESADPDQYDELEGHELDWQAFAIESMRSGGDPAKELDTTWEITGVETASGTGHKVPTIECLSDSQKVKNTLYAEGIIGVCADISYKQDLVVFETIEGIVRRLQSEDTRDGTTRNTPNVAARLLYFRSRLAKLTENEKTPWAPEVQNYAGRLQIAIQDTMTQIMSGNMKLKGEWHAACAVFWRINCKVLDGSRAGNHTVFPVYIGIKRINNSWHVERSDLEAVLGLWTWSLRDSVSLDTACIPKAFAWCQSPQEIENAVADLNMWVSRTLPQPIVRECWPGIHDNLSVYQNRTPLSVQIPESGIRSCQKCSMSIVSVPTRNNLLQTRAQEVFTSFITAVTSIISDLSDATCTPVPAPQIDRSLDVSLHRYLRISNSHIDSLAKPFVDAGLGTQEEALMTVVASLRLHPDLDLPLPTTLDDTLLALAQQNRKEENFHDAEDLLKWMLSNRRSARQLIPEGLVREIGELYRRAIRHNKATIRELGYRGIEWMLREFQESTFLHHVVKRYGWMAIKMPVGVEGFREKSYKDSFKQFKTIYPELEDDFNPVATAFSAAVEALRRGDFRSYCVSLIFVHSWKVDPQQPLSMGETILTVAVKGGYIELIEDLLEMGANCNHKDFSGRTPIFYASKSGYENVVRLLIAAGADVSVIDKAGITPLSLAAMNNHEAVVKLLLESGAKVDTGNIFHKSALFYAAEEGHASVVKLLLERGANIAAKHDHMLDTALLKAASNGHVSVVEVLLANNANVEDQNLRQDRPLKLAAENGHYEVAKVLLEKGANIEATDNYKQTALIWAAKGGHSRVVELLLENGANIEVLDSHERTPLSWAAEHGHESVVRLLLDKNAEIDVVDDKGGTPLLLAARWGFDAVVKILLEKGCNIEAQDEFEYTALSWAAKKSFDSVVKVLLDHGANIEHRTTHGQTPLILAADSDYKCGTEVVQLLLQKGADVEAKQFYHGDTALLNAAGRGHEPIVRLLLEKNADIEARDEKFKETPLIRAAGKGHKSVVELLLKHNANFKAQERDGETALDIARRRGYDEIEELLLDKMGISEQGDGEDVTEN